MGKIRERERERERGGGGGGGEVVSNTYGDLFTYICRWTMRWHWSMLHMVERVKNPKKPYIYSHWKLNLSSLIYVAPSLFSDSSNSNFLDILLVC